MQGAYLGPNFTNTEIINYLDSINAKFILFEDEDLFSKVANLIDDGNVIGWFNGRMEFGPRVLGARSIIGDPRNKKMQSVMNLKIKYRKSRPFAPSILEEDVSNKFKIGINSPYMLLVAPIREEFRKVLSNKEKKLFGIDQQYSKINTTSCNACRLLSKNSDC